MTNERSTGADSSEVTNQDSIGQQDMMEADDGAALQGEVVVADINDAPNPLTGTLDATQNEAQTSSQLSRLPEQDAFTALLALSEHVSSRFPLSTPPHSTDDQQPTDDLHTAIAAEEEPNEAPTLLQMNEPQVLEPISVSPSGCERSQESSDSSNTDKGLEMPMVPEFCERRQIGYQIVRHHSPMRKGEVPESDTSVADSEDEHEDHGVVKIPLRADKLMKMPVVATARATEDHMEKASARTSGRTPQKDVARTPLKTAEASTPSVLQQADEAGLLEQQGSVNTPRMTEKVQQETEVSTASAQEEQLRQSTMRMPGRTPQEDVSRTSLKKAEAKASTSAQREDEAGLQEQQKQVSTRSPGETFPEDVARTPLRTATATTPSQPLQADEDPWKEQYVVKTPLKTAEATESTSAQQADEAGLQEQQRQVSTRSPGKTFPEDVVRTHLKTAEATTPSKPLQADEDPWKEQYVVKTPLKTAEATTTETPQQADDAGLKQKLEQPSMSNLERRSHEDVAGAPLMTANATTLRTPLNADDDGLQDQHGGVKAPQIHQEIDVATARALEDVAETHSMPGSHARTPTPLPADEDDQQEAVDQEGATAYQIAEKDDNELVTARAQEQVSQGLVTTGLLKPSKAIEEMLDTVVFSVISHEKVVDEEVVGTSMNAADVTGREAPQDSAKAPQDVQKMQQATIVAKAPASEEESKRSLTGTPQPPKEFLAIKDELERVLFNVVRHETVLDEELSRTEARRPQLEVFTARGQEEHLSLSSRKTAQKSTLSKLESDMVTERGYGERESKSQNVVQTPQKSDQIKQRSGTASARDQKSIVAPSAPNTPQKTDQVRVETEMFTAPCHGEQLSQSFTRTPQKVEQTSVTEMFTAPSHGEQQSQTALKTPVKSEPVQGIEDRLDTLVFNVIRHVMVLDDDLPKTPQKSADVSRTPQQDRKGVITPAKELDMVTARSRFGEQPSQARVTTAKKAEEQKALDERLETSIWNLVSHEAVLGENDSIATKKTSTKLQNVADVGVSTAREDATTQQILANWLELDVVRTTLHEQTDNVISRSLQSEQDTPASQWPNTDQEITTAVAKTPEPKQQAEFSLAKMFPALFGRSAPVVEQGSAADAQSDAAAPAPPPLASSRLAPFKLPQQPAKPRNPKQDVTRFRSEYANKFAIGSQHTVDFFSGSYDDAQREARNGVRLIIVFIHDPTLEDSSKLINESLNTIEFGDLVTTHNLLVWGVSNDSEEGKYVAYNLHVNKYPFLSLMCPRADNRFFSARRITGFTPAAELVNRLQKSIEIARVDLKDLREQKEKLLADRRLMEEQEKAYKESAERDKQKILEAKRARQEQKEAEEREKRKRTEAEERRKVITAQRELLRQEVLVEPVGKTKDVVRVQVRFPSGQKFTRKFALDDSLEKLFAAIICSEDCPIFFTVAAGFPRSPIHCAPEWYHKVLCEQMAADGFAPTTFKQPSSFRAAGLSGAVGVFVNNYGS